MNGKDKKIIAISKETEIYRKLLREICGFFKNESIIREPVAIEAIGQIAKRWETAENEGLQYATCVEAQIDAVGGIDEAAKSIMGG